MSCGASRGRRSAVRAGRRLQAEDVEEAGHEDDREQCGRADDV